MGEQTNEDTGKDLTGVRKMQWAPLMSMDRIRDQAFTEADSEELRQLPYYITTVSNVVYEHHRSPGFCASTSPR